MLYQFLIYALTFIAPFQSQPHATTHHQASQSLPRFTCYRDRHDNRPWKKRLWDGYEISLGPTPHAADDPENACTAAIYNRGGKVVYRTTGYSVRFDEQSTGEDFGGDGKPDVVFHTDTGGGMHCCWSASIISLSPKPHKLADIPEPGQIRFDKDADGKMTIDVWTPGPYGFSSMAAQPFAHRIFQFRERKLMDVTPELCSKIHSTANENLLNGNPILTPENIKKLQSPGDDYTENEEIVNALLSRATQEVFCHKYEEALSDIDLWPEATKAKLKAAFADWAKDDYPEFAARLRQPVKPAQ